MASQPPPVPVTSERVVSEWSAGAITQTTARTDASRLNDTESMEFILSSNWALRLEGIKDFYEVLYKRDENLEIQYDYIIHGFRVKCFSYDEVRIVSLVKEILDQLVQSEAEKGLETSYKITSLEDWRKSKFRPGEEPKLPGKYSFPCHVSVCKFQSTWNIPEHMFKKGITINRMLPESALSQLRQLAGATLVASSDKRTVYVGAPRTEVVNIVKRKLDTLVRFVSLLPKDATQVVEIFFHNEGDRSTKGEYRYVADGNDRLLRSYILDRFDWPHPELRYPTVFQKGVLIRLNPNNEPWDEVRALSSTILPIVKEAGSKEEFGAFTLTNWRYPAKGPVIKPSEAISNTTTTRSESSQITHGPILGPEIENWVSRLPVRDHNWPNSYPQKAVPSSSETQHKPGCDDIISEGPQRLSTTPQLNDIVRSKPGTAGDQSNLGYPAPAPPPHSPLLDIEPIVDLVQDNCAKLPSSNIITVNGAGDDEKQPTDSMRFAADETTTSVGFEQPKSKTDCPFELLWNKCRPAHVGASLRPAEDQNKNSVLSVSQLTETSNPQVDQNSESGSRSFHMTMNQKAGARTAQRNIFPDIDPNIITSINKSLEILLAPLRMWPGNVDLRIDLGRFCFLNVKRSRIQEAGDDDDEKYYMLEQIRSESNKRHKANEKLYFTRVLTTLGVEANYIALMSDNDGKPMWKRPSEGRSSTFEFICRKALQDGELNFFVEVDTRNFTHKIRVFKPDQNCFMVHCTKRVWDFRLTLSASPELDDACQQFAEDLVGSLRVTPNNDRLPELEISYNKSYNIEILAVRTRNRACCTNEVDVTSPCSTQKNPRKDILRLYISEVWEMALLSSGEVEQCIQLKFVRYKDNEHTDIPLRWYEASLKSDNFCMAFKQNEELELGDEVKWTSKNLVHSGTIERLVQKAASMVKNMDGVGFWNDNHQEHLLRRFDPLAKDTVDKFW
ncbi:hypothetical protein F5B22DRAFT_657072 [Xylaria bambusicola]|uniref:uncharacterized protein n=1 Tax=Xylaria bambusicola TaxID=326684 RepID=UPI002007F1AD|nr:uncharacterized protein F5B22DRAFT_657072 [Xylaria bambusicola]KAI0525795.1 hypothetical protein F5B22DRAFT_657072 [Xylaria bambusicola]